MDAASFIKSSRVVLLASALTVGTSVAAAAQDAPIALSGAPSGSLASNYAAPPSGQVTLGGHTFDLTSGTFLGLSNGQSVSFSGSYPGFNGAYLLLNSANTLAMWLDQQPVGNVVLTFSDGSTQSTDLTVGVNLREWRTGAGPVYVTELPIGCTLPAATACTANVWSGTATDGTAAVIDMLSIPASTASKGKTLTSVTLNNTNAFPSSFAILLAGLTVDVTPPAPTPTLTCPEAGNASPNWATKDKHLAHCAEQASRIAARQAGQAAGGSTP
jgi:hypothetical protein